MEGYRLRMLGNRSLRKTFGSKREEETGGLRKSHNGYLHTRINPSKNTTILS